MTPSNADRQALNNLIQRGLEHRGLLSARRLSRRSSSRRTSPRQKCSTWPDLTAKDVDRSTGVVLLDHDGREVRWKPSVASKVEVYAREARALHVGDLIRWTRNDPANGRINAEVGRVVAIDRNQHRADVLVNGALHRLDLDRQGHWELAYATTIHAAQGRTADRVLLHLDTSKPHLISHEGWYVGISRARSELRIFTDSVERLPEQIRTSLQQESALGVVARSERGSSSPQHHDRVVARPSELQQVENASRVAEDEHRAALQRENVKRLVDRQRVLRSQDKKRNEHQVLAAERKQEPERAEIVRQSPEQSRREKRRERGKKKDRQ